MRKYYLFILLLNLLVLIIILGCFSIIGTPFEQKAINLDKQRLTALNEIENEIKNYAYSNPLPENLKQIATLNSEYYQKLLIDPETKQPYEYKYVSPTTYQLCATFSTDSSKQQDNYLYAFGSQNKKLYKKGAECFSYTVTEITKSRDNNKIYPYDDTNPTTNSIDNITYPEAQYDTKRRSDVLQILNGIHQYMFENNAVLPSNLPATNSAALEISSVSANICKNLVPKYMPELPQDPLVGPGVKDCTSSYKTGYKVMVSQDNKITVSARNDKNGIPISIIR